MRSLLCILVFAACTEHGRGGGTGVDPDLTDPGNPPDVCGCVVDAPPTTSGDCCDSQTCFFDEEAGQWQVVICDGPPVDQCLFCATDEICVQAFDGTCTSVSACVPRTVECPDNVCTPDCELAYCGDGVSQCQNPLPCGTESPLAFTCYGP